MGDWRPRSADETTVPAWSPQRTEDSRLLHGAEDTGRLRGMFRPRPVSTGKRGRQGRVGGEMIIPVDPVGKPLSPTCSGGGEGMIFK